HSVHAGHTPTRNRAGNPHRPQDSAPQSCRTDVLRQRQQLGNRVLPDHHLQERRKKTRTLRNPRRLHQKSRRIRRSPVQPLHLPLDLRTPSTHPQPPRPGRRPPRRHGTVRPRQSRLRRRQPSQQDHLPPDEHLPTTRRRRQRQIQRSPRTRPDPLPRIPHQQRRRIQRRRRNRSLWSPCHGMHRLRQQPPRPQLHPR